ncbi:MULTISPECIES: hypothetical protein [Ramlibacter]|nr:MULTISPECIES: hypothetical protein [Ramlibacter]
MTFPPIASGLPTPLPASSNRRAAGGPGLQATPAAASTGAPAMQA